MSYVNETHILQDFPSDARVDLPNIRIDEVIITINRDNRDEPMRITVQVIGCFHPSKFSVTNNLII